MIFCKNIRLASCPWGTATAHGVTDLNLHRGISLGSRAMQGHARMPYGDLPGSEEVKTERHLGNIYGYIIGMRP